MSLPPAVPGPPTGPAVPGMPPPAEYAGDLPVDGVRYHRQVQDRGGAWWRLLVSLLTSGAALLLAPALAIVAIVLLARAIGHGFDFNLDDGLSAAEMLGVNLGLASLIPAAWLGYWAIYRRRPRWLSSVTPGLRVSWLATCFAMTLAVWALLMALVLVAAVAERKNPVDSGVVWLLVVVLLTTPLQAAGEEYLFRGLMLQSLGATRLPTWLCCVASGAVFATAHAQFSPPLFADRLALGAVFAWLAIRTGGLEAGIAIHTVKNYAGLIPAAFLDDVSQTLDPHDVSWLPFAVDVVLLAILVPWMFAVVRRRERTGRQATFRTSAASEGV